MVKVERARVDRCVMKLETWAGPEFTEPMGHDEDLSLYPKSVSKAADKEF